jgi:tripartite ATP-independent transporter DctM subunit
MEVAILILCFLTLLAIGVPIAYSIGISSIVTLVINMDFLTAFTTVAQRMATGLDSFALLAIPFFIMAGQIMNQGGIATRLVNFAKAMIGFLPGGLAYVNILSCMMFGAISGSAVAAASAIGGFMIPRMTKEGYPKPFSAAVNITSSTTGLVIPPSNILIVYSLASGGVSVAALFLAGYLPGFLMGVALIIVASVYAVKKKLPTAGTSTLKELIRYFVDAFPSLLLLIIVMGGIVAGIFTATEASAIAVVYTFILAVVIYKEIKFRDLAKVLLETVKTTSVVLLLVATSMAMSWVMSYESIPQDVSAALLSLSDNKFVILMIINLTLLTVGIFMFTPIFLPVVTNLGINPVHFGIIMVVNLCIGLCTPPVGSVLFVGVSVAKIKIQEVIRPLVPLFLALIFVLILITYIPEISMFIPGLFGF